MPKIIYGCQICGRQYSTEQDAIICETQPPDERLADVGDVVAGGKRFGWFDGDKAWVMDPKVKKGYIAFYYVVTHIDGHEDNAHRVRYHLFTNAMTGKEGYRSGWTFNSGHYALVKAKGPPEKVMREAKTLVGSLAEHLL